MHEMALCESILDIVKAAAARRSCLHINCVRIEVGAMAAVEPDAMRFCFDAISRGTIAEGANLEIIHIPGRAWCTHCDNTVEVSRRYDPCPACGGEVMRFTGGDELRVRDMEVQ